MAKPKHNHPFIKFVRRECKRHGVKFVLQHTSEISEDEFPCGGYFSEEPPELVVATRVLYPYFLSTLVHEYSHMLQWLDKDSVTYHVDYWDIFNRWLSGENFKKSTIKRCIRIIRDCEVDCDRRAVELIKKHKLPINIEKYEQRAGAYAYFYNYIRYTRKWEYNNDTEKLIRISEKLPPKLDGDYSKTPRKVMRLFKKHMR